MVAVENLNQDCLELIYDHLFLPDLFSLSLVSRTFLSSVTPRLYRSLPFHVDHAKRYTKILNVFAIIQRHPSYAAFVRAVDVRAVPIYRGMVHSTFLRDYVKTVEMSRGITSFTCTQSALVPPSLKALQGHANIRSIRINAKLDQDQSASLQRLRGLDSIALDASTWNVIDILPRWTGSMSITLASLTLHSLTELNDTILTSAVSALPNLHSFHVVNCTKIKHNLVIKLTAHLPRLQSLAFTCWDQTTTLTDPTPLPHLRHLAVDNHIDATSGHWKPSWTSFLSATRDWNCSLNSITLRPYVRTSLSDSSIKELLDAHDATLEHVMLLNCAISISGMTAIASRCTSLQRLGVSIPHKDIPSAAEALCTSSTLDTLQDIGDTLHQNGTRSILSKDGVRILMDLVPSLRKVIAWDRLWTRHRRSDDVDEGFELTFEKRRDPTPSHWFAPPSLGWS